MAYTKSLSEFLNHRSRESSTTQYLSGWRNRQPPELTAWLHTKVLPVPVWQHNWPKIVDKSDGSTAVWGGSFACLESEAVLKKQRHRDRKTGRREVPPTVCPICLLNEYIREAIQAGQINWTDVLFRYRAGDDQRILHAAGIFGGFNLRNPTQEQLDELKAAGIDRGGPEGAWREDATAKCKYVFRVVDHDEPDKGVQIAVEQELLGQKVQQCIAKEIESAMDSRKDPDGNRGNPLVNPYAIKFKYYPTEKEFGKRYDAVAMRMTEMTDQIRELIYEAPVPSISRVREPWNLRTMRSLMEQACQFDLDFDAIFGPAEANCDANGVYQLPKEDAEETESDDADFDPEKIEAEAKPPAAEKKKKMSVQVPAPKAEAKPSPAKVSAKAPAKAPATSGRKAVVPAEPPEGYEPCVGKNGKCGEMLAPDCLQCPKCGQRYEIQADGEEDAPPWAT